MSNPDSLDLWFKQGTFNYLRLYGEDRQNPISGWLYVDKGSVVTKDTAEISAHADLSDMPDVGGTVSDHDARYYTEGEIDTALGLYLKADGTTQLTGIWTSNNFISATSLYSSGTIKSDATLYGNEVDTNKIYNNGATLTVGEAGDIELGDGTLRDMYPKTDLMVNLGKVDYRFNKLYSSSGSFSSGCSFGSTCTFEGATIGVDHDDLTNTHNLTTDIDHDTITNNHNLTTDIDHDALTNFEADEHFTKIDFRDDDITWSGTHQFDSSVTFNSKITISGTNKLCFATGGESIQQPSANVLTMEAGDGTGNILMNCSVFTYNTTGTYILPLYDTSGTDGVFGWFGGASQDYFYFADDILMATSEKLFFRDSSVTMYSPASGDLIIETASTVTISSPSVFIDGDLIIKDTLTYSSVVSSYSTVDWNDGNIQSDAPLTNVTYTFTAPPNPAVLYFIFTQDSTARTITWPATVHWPHNINPIPSQGSGEVDLYKFVYNGTNYLGSVIFDLS